MDTSDANVHLLRQSIQKPTQKNAYLLARTVFIMYFVFTTVLSFVIHLEDIQSQSTFRIYSQPRQYFRLIWFIIMLYLFLLSLYNTIVNNWNHQVLVLISLVNTISVLKNAIFYEETIACLYICLWLSFFMILFNFQAFNEVGYIMREAYVIPKYLSRNALAFLLGHFLVNLNIEIGRILVYDLNVEKKIQSAFFFGITALICMIISSLIGLREGKKGILASFAIWISVIEGLVGAYINYQSCKDGQGDNC